MKIWKVILPMAVVAMLVQLASCGGGGAAERERIDSLNALSAEVRYASLERAMEVAEQAESLAVACGYADGRCEAVLNRGDVYGMRMDYDSARWCYGMVLDELGSGVLRCRADVGMMSLCLMTARNNEFYDYRGDAVECMAGVAEEDMSERQYRMWMAVQVEYHCVLANYFMKMWQDDSVAEEMEWFKKNRGVFEDDVVLMSKYLFLRSMCDVPDVETEDVVDEKQRELMRLASMGRRAGNVYFEALGLNGLARSMLLSRSEMKLSRRVFLEELMEMEESELDDVGFAEVLAGHSLQLAEQYGNALLQTMAMVTLSDCYLASGRDSLALVQMEKALELINEHRNERLSACSASGGDGGCAEDGVLVTYSPVEDSISTEMRWIADPDVMAVPEWMAMVREQLSIVYGAMGLKAESDYNHNIYFDILDVTRQDRRVQQEVAELGRDARWLTLFLWVTVCVCLAMLLALLRFSRVSRAAYRSRVEALEQRIESDTYLAGRRLEENKRRHVDKLTSLSIVNGITPFLNRAMHEVGKLKAIVADGKGGTEETCIEESVAEMVGGRLDYLGELIDKINEYNDVLGHWVKIRQGIVALNVENFALRPLFDTLRKGARTFETKGLRLVVRDTECVVKADKALTLFMMNTLLDNARKYTPQGGKVVLWAEETDAYVEVSVSDTGQGLSAEDVALINGSKVYDASKIGGAGTGAAAGTRHSSDAGKMGEASDGKGYGFGLMNCRGIIGKYRKTNALFSVCHFAVESQLGKGSRFFFRLPKGVMRVMTAVMAMFLLCVDVAAESRLSQPSQYTDSICSDSEDDHLACATQYADSMYVANVAGEHGRVLFFADCAIAELNAHYLSVVGTGGEQTFDARQGKPMMSLYGARMAELDWWRDGICTDYDLIIRIRNEVAIASLALNRIGIYRYNSEAFTRLYRLLSTDTSLVEQCSALKIANRMRLTVLIVLIVMLVLLSAAYLLLWLRHCLQQSCLPVLPDAVSHSSFATCLKAVAGKRVELLKRLFRIADPRVERIEQMQEECLRIESEQQQIYVRNQILDNCLSALKHETMYYPSRIKQIVDTARTAVGSHIADAVSDIDELLSYYMEVFSILSTCAARQVEKVLFRRTTLSAQQIGEMAEKSFMRQCRKLNGGGTIRVSKCVDGLSVQCDRIFIQILLDSIISLHFEHKSDGDLLLDFDTSDGFAVFSFCDTAYTYSEEEIPLLFHVDNVKYDASSGRLLGSGYLLCRQIIREHDAHSSMRGCRVYVENCAEGAGSRFVFTLPLAQHKNTCTI